MLTTEQALALARLRASQERFRENWPGRYVVLRSAEEAVQWWREEAA